MKKKKRLRLFAFMLACIVLFTSAFMKFEEHKAYATSVVITGVGAAAGEAIGELLIYMLALGGLFECTDGELFEPIDTDSIYDMLYDMLLNYDEYCPDVANIRDSILFKVDEFSSFEEYCEKMADILSDALAHDIDLLGNAIDYSDLSSYADSSFIVADKGSDNLVISSPAFNDMVLTLDTLVDGYVEYRNTIVTDSGLSFDLSFEVEDMDWSIYGGFDSLCNRYSGCSYFMFLCSDNTPGIYYARKGVFEYVPGANYFTVVNVDGSERVPENNVNYRGYYATGSSYGYTGTSPNFSYSYLEGKRIIAFNGLSDTLTDVLGIPAERDIFGDSKDVPDIDSYIEGITDAWDFDRSRPIIDTNEMVIVGTRDDIDVPDIPFDEPITDEEARDIVVPWVNENTKESAKDISDEAADNLGIPKDDSNEDNPPMVNTGWGWLDSILNKILEVLYDIWSAITGLVSGIVNGIVNGIGSFFNSVLDVLYNIYTVVNGLVSGFVDGVVNGFKTLLSALFVPDDDFLDNLVNKAGGHFDFFSGIYANVDRFVGFFNDNSNDKPPKIVVDLSIAEGKVDYGDEAVIDFAWFARYKPMSDDFISAFLWGIFIWNTFRQLPSIISGVGDFKHASAEIEERKNDE